MLCALFFFVVGHMSATPWDSTAEDTMRPIHYYLYDFVRYALGLVVIMIAALRRHISVTDVMVTVIIAVVVGHWTLPLLVAPGPAAPGPSGRVFFHCRPERRQYHSRRHAPKMLVTRTMKRWRATRTALESR